MPKEFAVGSEGMRAYENTKRFAHSLIELEARRVQAYAESFEPSWRRVGKRSAASLREELLGINQRERSLLAVAQNPLNDVSIEGNLESRLTYTLKLVRAYQQHTIQLHRSFLDAEANFLRNDGSITPLLLTCEKLIAHLEEYAKDFGPYLRAENQQETSAYRYSQQLDVTQENLLQPLHDAMTTLRALLTRRRAGERNHPSTFHWE